MNANVIKPENQQGAREETLRSMLGDFYSKRMRSTAILVWVVGLAWLGLAVFSTVHFFKSEETKSQIMFAALFIVALQGVSLMKSFAWGMIHRCSIQRELDRLEAHVAALQESLKTKS